MAEQTTEDARERDKRIAEGIGWHGLEWGGVPDWSNDPAAVFGPGGLVEAMAKMGWSVQFKAMLGDPIRYRAWCQSAERVTEDVDGSTPMAAISAAAAAALRGAETRTDDGE